MEDKLNHEIHVAFNKRIGQLEKRIQELEWVTFGSSKVEAAKDPQAIVYKSKDGRPVHFSHNPGFKGLGFTVAVAAPDAEEFAKALQKKDAIGTLTRPFVRLKVGISRVNSGKKSGASIHRVRQDYYNRAEGRKWSMLNMREVDAELVSARTKDAGTPKAKLLYLLKLRWEWPDKDSKGDYKGRLQEYRLGFLVNPGTKYAFISYARTGEPHLFKSEV
jgi:hypothetical protein